MKVVISVFFGWGTAGLRCGGPGDCPPHHCSRDDAVIHGYCCGCGRYTGKCTQLFTATLIMKFRADLIQEMHATIQFRI